jgi:hypothetical protein
MRRHRRRPANLHLPGDLVLLIDPTTREIYVCAERDQINSWLRTLAQIRQWPTTWPTRWFRPEAP